MKIIALAIAMLIGSNIVLGALLLRERQPIAVEHVGQLRLDIKNGGILHVKLQGPQDKELALTPRGAIELSSALNRMLVLVQQAAKEARERPKGQDL